MMKKNELRKIIKEEILNELRINRPGSKYSFWPDSAFEGKDLAIELNLSFLIVGDNAKDMNWKARNIADVATIAGEDVRGRNMKVLRGHSSITRPQKIGESELLEQNYERKIGKGIFQIKLIKRVPGRHSYRITLKKGSWPTEDGMIKALEGTFGGRMKKTSDRNVRIFDIYVD